MNEKIIKILIILFSVIILIICCTIIFLKRNTAGASNEKYNIEQFDAGKEFEDNENGFQPIDDPNIYFSVIELLSNYLKILSYDVGDTDNDNVYNVSNEQEKNSVIMSLLDSEYIKNNDLVTNEVNEKLENFDYEYTIIPADMRVRIDNNISIYVVNIYLENIENLNLEERYYLVRLDNNNLTFSVEPLIGITDIDKVVVSTEKETISKNKYNSYELETISIERLVKIYMDNYINMLLKHPELVYDKYMSEEYRDKRFESVDNLIDYVDKNREDINGLRATGYSINNGENKREYIVQDQYGNLYKFYEKYTMSYIVEMDTYTILTDNFKTEYDNGDEQKKVAMNIDKWVQMLNNRDYKSAYSVLDETFRNSNWGSEEEFERYMRENLPLHYEVEYTNFSNENSIYVQTITLSDITGENDSIANMNVIMKLNDNYDYVMSFQFINE